MAENPSECSGVQEHKPDVFTWICWGLTGLLLLAQPFFVWGLLQ